MGKCSVNVDLVGDRFFLSSLCEAALNKADQVANQNWKQAYGALAAAADYCDAVNARSGDTPNEKVQTAL